MLRVGLTGGIACGKSAVADAFAAHGVPIIDADIIARELVEPGEPALEEIAQTLGREFIDASGRLDRARLREHIFANPDARRELEAILHPRIASEMLARSNRLNTPYCILVIPLLIETGQQHLVDRILVVDCPPEAQRSRLMQRDDASPQQVAAILDAQVERQQRLAAADDIIKNNATLAYVKEQVDSLHAQYLSLA